MDWQKVIQAILAKAETYQDKADVVKISEPGLHALYQKRAVELREQAEFLVAGLE